jgi:hypothetical protein
MFEALPNPHGKHPAALRLKKWRRCSTHSAKTWQHRKSALSQQATEVREMEMLATAALVLVIGMSLDACVEIFMGRRGE